MAIRKKQKGRKEDLHTRHLRRVQAVMKALGVNDQYRRLKPVERDHILRFQSAAPQVVLPEDVEGADHLHAQLVLGEFKDALSVAMIQLAGTENWIPLKDFFRIAEPLTSLYRHPEARATSRPRLDALAQAFFAVVDLIEATFEDAMLMLFNSVGSVLINNSRIDERLYWFDAKVSG